MRRAVVNVAFGEHYLRGQERLRKALPRFSPEADMFLAPCMSDWTRHAQKPYAFKPYAMRYAAECATDLLLWLDAAVKPVRSLEPLWERIERDGYWFAENAWNNYQWTADSAYPALFPGCASFQNNATGELIEGLDAQREINKSIPHVLACAFGLNLRSEIGAAFLREYCRLASETDCFCGPWSNSNYTGNVLRQSDSRTAPCGPSDVIGHRHDQTAASVIAWRLGMKLTPGHRDPEGDILVYPEWFPNRRVPERCILVHDGSME
jgi:hypothetical protein